MEEIHVRKAVLHILDNSINIPVLSSSELETDVEIADFLEKHITRLMEDNNTKSAAFTGESDRIRSLCDQLKEDRESFLETSTELAGMLFDIMTKHVDIAPADLVCCLYECCGQAYLGILKMNYKTGFTHYVEPVEEGNTNRIIRYRTILPSEAQKIDEGALINLEDGNIRLMEKQYEINGEKEFYFSKLFLGCSTELSNNEKVKILDRVAKKINKKYFDEDFDKAALMKKAVSESLEETSAIQVDAVVQEVFENNIEVRDEYISEIRKAGLTETTLSIPDKLVEKKFRTHRIQTDTGIEIGFPSSYYNDSEKMEFVNNPDGTISIIIKNIGKIINK